MRKEPEERVLLKIGSFLSTKLRKPAWRCMECHAAACRSSRRHLRERHTDALASRLLSSDAKRVLAIAHALAVSCGGWERLLNDLPAVERARLAVKMRSASEVLAARAAESASRSAAAVRAGAADPGVIAAAAQLLAAAGWKLKQPEPKRPKPATECPWRVGDDTDCPASATCGKA